MKIIVLGHDENFIRKINEHLNNSFIQSEIKCFVYEDFLNKNIIDELKNQNDIICLLDTRIGKTELLSSLNKLDNIVNLIVLDINDEKYVKIVVEGIKKYISYARKEDSRLYVKTFGQFDVYCKGEVVDFKRSKTKELLAILIDNKGSIVSPEEIGNLLYEDGIYDRKRQKELHVYISDLRKTLESCGFDNIIIKSALGYSLNLDYIYCDYYELLNGNKYVGRYYDGRYMYQYSWSNLTNSYIERIVLNSTPTGGGVIVKCFFLKAKEIIALLIYTLIYFRESMMDQKILIHQLKWHVVPIKMV